MQEYIKPVHPIRNYKFPRKEKKRIIKDWGRDFYYDFFIYRDSYDGTLYVTFFPEEYDKEMIKRKEYLQNQKMKIRKEKLKRILDDKIYKK